LCRDPTRKRATIEKGKLKASKVEKTGTGGEPHAIHSSSWMGTERGKKGQKGACKPLDEEITGPLRRRRETMSLKEELSSVILCVEKKKTTRAREKDEQEYALNSTSGRERTHRRNGTTTRGETSVEDCWKIEYKSLSKYGP